MKINKLAKLAVLAALAMPALISTQVSAETQTWGPERTTYTWNNPANERTFNSITDNPGIGDERNFVRIREAGVGTYGDTVTLKAGKEYEVYIYYHNNAKASLNSSGKGIADNVRVSSSMPTVLYENQLGQVRADITASNTNPARVWDTAYVRSDSTLYLKYVANSATIHNQGSANGKILDADALFSSDGAKIAYWADSAEDWGMIPGCNEYAGYITYRVKAVEATGKIDKTVAQEGQTNFANDISISPDGTLDFKVTYTNTSELAESDVILHDAMPNGLEYIAGTTFVTTPSNKNGAFTTDTLFGTGVNIGTLQAGESAMITYKAKALAAEKFSCGETALQNNASVAYKVLASPKDDVFTLYDKVTIKVTRTCKPDDPEPETPVVPNVPETPETPTTPTTPSEIPSTGPAEVVFAVLIIAGIGTGVWYFFKSRKDLKVTTAKVADEPKESKEESEK